MSFDDCANFFQKESWRPFWSFSEHFPWRCAAIQGMRLNVVLCTLASQPNPIESDPDGKSRHCFDPTNVWKIHCTLSLSTNTFDFQIHIMWASLKKALFRSVRKHQEWPINHCLMISSNCDNNIRGVFAKTFKLIYYYHLTIPCVVDAD